MPIEIFFKNSIFITLFFSTIIFWTENSVSLQLEPARRLKETTNSHEEAELSGSTPKELQNSSRFLAGLEHQVKSGGQVGKKFFLLSFSLITCELLYRWYLSGHPPLSNLYESLLFLIWGLLATNFIGNFAKRLQSSLKPESGRVSRFAPEGASSDLEKFGGAITSSTALFLQTFADWRLPDEMREIKPLIPALQSNWLLMHVSIMILSYAALLFGCLLSISYVVMHYIAQNAVNLASSERAVQTPLSLSRPAFTNPQGAEVGLQSDGARGKTTLDWTSHLKTLDSLSYRVLSFGFPLLTLGILSGAVWANQAWGSYWSWDPKETWAFITWLIFAFYLHTRLQYGWEGVKSANLACFGFFIIWICYLGVNLLGKGLHSYGWLN